jgi:transcriptional regulator with XRE-family HTH domain
MDENEKIEERKRENGRFLSAFKYMMKANGLTQDELAKRMGKSSSLISDYKSGKKRVSEDTSSWLLHRLSFGLSLGIS